MPSLVLFVLSVHVLLTQAEYIKPGHVPNLKEVRAETSGSFGDGVTWTLSQDYLTLTFSGTGRMKDLSSPEGIPWISYVSNIESIVISSGIQSIGDYSFHALFSRM